MPFSYCIECKHEIETWKEAFAGCGSCGLRQLQYKDAFEYLMEEVQDNTDNIRNLLHTTKHLKAPEKWAKVEEVIKEPKFTKDEKLKALAQYKFAVEELSWLGSKDPQCHEDIRREYNEAHLNMLKILGI